MQWWEYGDTWEEIDKFWHDSRTSRRMFRPKALKDNMITSSMVRITKGFDSGDFGVISASGSDCSKKENLESLFLLAMRVVGMGYRPEAHIGFWDDLDDRCLFVPKIQKQETQTLAREYGQRAYIWGNTRNWQCYNTSSGEITANGNVLKVICPDETFLLFTRIKKRKLHFLTLLDYIKNDSGTSKSFHTRTVKDIIRKLSDLDRLEREIISEEKWQ